MRKTGGAALEGIEYPYPQGESTSAFSEFAARYRLRFGSEPNNDAAAGHDLAAILIKAFKGCGSENPQCVQSYVRGIGNFEGLGGKLAMARSGAALRPYGIKRYKDGKYEWIRRDIVPIEPGD